MSMVVMVRFFIFHLVLLMLPEGTERCNTCTRGDKNDGYVSFSWKMETTRSVKSINIILVNIDDNSIITYNIYEN